jgi:hypothetical protein
MFLSNEGVNSVTCKRFQRILMLPVYVACNYFFYPVESGKQMGMNLDLCMFWIVLLIFKDFFGLQLV